jgi:cell wall-associated NlpC family hydrolase
VEEAACLMPSILLEFPYVVNTKLNLARRSQEQQSMKGNTPSDRRSALECASPGDIVVFHHARGWSRLIPRFSGSRYHHVGLYAGGPWIIESRITGVMKRDVSAAKLRLRFRVIPAPGGPAVGRVALEWAQGQLGVRYAYLSIGALLLDRVLEKLFGPMDIVWRQRDRVSCGELVAQAYEVAGVRLFPDREPEEVAPWDFAQMLRRHNTRT